MSSNSFLENNRVISDQGHLILHPDYFKDPWIVEHIFFKSCHA